MIVYFYNQISQLIKWNSDNKISRPRYWRKLFEFASESWFLSYFLSMCDNHFWKVMECARTHTLLGFQPNEAMRCRLWSIFILEQEYFTTACQKIFVCILMEETNKINITKYNNSLFIWNLFTDFHLPLMLTMCPT